MPTERIPLGEILVTNGATSRERISEALRVQELHGGRLGDILVRRRRVGAETVARALAQQLALPYAPAPLTPQPAALALLPWEISERPAVLPLTANRRVLRVAVAEPSNLGLIDDIGFRTGRRVEVLVASRTAIDDAVRSVQREELPALIGSLPQGDSSVNAHDLEAIAASAPVVRIVDHLLREAAEAGTSDVHIERVGESVRIRNRIDGVLQTVLTLPGPSHAAIVSRIKVMAGMDIAVKRRPQDGGFTLRHGADERRLRVSTVPVEGGEKVVLRILDPHGAPTRLTDLGMDPDDAERLRQVALAGQGVLLAVGPTGSGKSSSLFAALNQLNAEGRNVVTIEDPVEYVLPGVNQIQVSPHAGMTFPSALRATLRQDPDVIMIGEIRDRETAEIAMAAAVTGHLVLSTLHTWDAPGAIARLLDMGVPPFLVASGLAGVVAQRLLRTLCTTCSGRTAEGCDACVGGYRGRTGVFQILVMTDSLREAVARGAGAPELRRRADESGMRTLADAARRKIAEGLTTPHEAARIVNGDAAGASPCGACGGNGPADAPGCVHCGRPRRHACPCGRSLQRSWRYCPECLHPITRAA